MRLSFDISEEGQVAVVTLSRRNLLALLHKLDMPCSARTLEAWDCPTGWVLRVRSDDDATHYETRPFPPGPMHPKTEAFIHAQERPADDRTTNPDGPEGRADARH